MPEDFECHLCNVGRSSSRRRELLIKGHNLSESKYRSLGIPSPQYYEVSNMSLKQYKEMIEEVVKVPVQICKI